MITVRKLRASERCLEGINRLLPQLSASGNVRLLTAGDIAEAFKNPNFFMLILEDSEKEYPECFVGMATIFFQRNFARWIAEIHDVVVDRNYRGQGLGNKLTQELIKLVWEFARRERTKIKLYLTSRPSREAANTLYAHMGFTLVATAHGEWGTNLYKMSITP